MKSNVFTRSAIALIIFGALCGLAACLAPRQGPQQAMWFSIIPPLLAISLAFLTRRVLVSLGVAILVGGLLTQIPQTPPSAAAWLEGFKTAGVHVTDTIRNKGNLQILAFIPPIFIMIEILIASGGFRGIIVWLLRWVKGGKSAQLATALMGILCFIDDYTNAIIVGSMMQPITDRFRVSRQKLAFLVDATSAPIAGLAVVSTWIAYEVGLLGQVGDKLGIGKSGYAMFFDALSFRFYCWLMIAFVFSHIVTGRDFGPMKAAEESARTRDGEDSAPPASGEAGHAVNALVPLAGLILFHVTGLWVDGGGPARLREGGSLLSLLYWRDVISAAEHTHLILDGAALFGLALALLFSQVFGSLRMSVILSCFKRGIKRALLPFAILILAWSLKNCCDKLETGQFLTTILADRVSPHLFPPILFFVASVTSFATGTSYGTMAILLPTAIPIAFALDGQTYGLTTMISVGAVLDGAIFGDHCSPISDTTIMSSISSSCDLIEHVRTQLPYSLLVAALALLFAYLPSGLGLAPGWGFVLALCVMLCFLTCFVRRGVGHRAEGGTSCVLVQEGDYMSKVQQAVSTFQSGFNCSQAIVHTYGPDYGLSPLDGLKVSCGFGGGMRRADTCGAVTGALMVLGLRYGPKDTSDVSAKTDVYAKVTEFCARFESRCGSVVCRDLLGCDISTPAGMEQAKADNLFKTVCPKMVQAAAEILEEMC